MLHKGVGSTQAGKLQMKLENQRKIKQNSCSYQIAEAAFAALEIEHEPTAL